ncbi:hypothetical protein MHYP_G00033730 [Metynnis hypsauchen]
MYELYVSISADPLVHSEIHRTERNIARTQEQLEDKLVLVTENLMWSEAGNVMRTWWPFSPSSSRKAWRRKLGHVWLGLRYSCSSNFRFWVGNRETGCYQNWALGRRTEGLDCGLAGTMGSDRGHRWAGRSQSDRSASRVLRAKRAVLELYLSTGNEGKLNLSGGAKTFSRPIVVIFPSRDRLRSPAGRMGVQGGLGCGINHTSFPRRAYISARRGVAMATPGQKGVAWERLLGVRSEGEGELSETEFIRSTGSLRTERRAVRRAVDGAEAPDSRMWRLEGTSCSAHQRRA